MDTIVVALVGGASAIIGALLTHLFQRGKTRADADKSSAEATDQITETVLKLLAPLNERICELETKIHELEAENDSLRDWATRLVNQVIGLGGVPVAFVAKAKKK